MDQYIIVRDGSFYGLGIMIGDVMVMKTEFFTTELTEAQGLKRQLETSDDSAEV